ncbi:MAG TPA: hypothetical protein VN783_12240 [Thermoanaerobaculia bacterium]|nr:hypothetical protein [Thermoanaerobaculia bacterium]
MSQVKQLEQNVQKLSPKDLAEFRRWFLEFDARLWDEQIEADQRAGKLDDLLSEARADFAAGKAREL